MKNWVLIFLAVLSASCSESSPMEEERNASLRKLAEIKNSFDKLLAEYNSINENAFIIQCRESVEQRRPKFFAFLNGKVWDNDGIFKKDIIVPGYLKYTIEGKYIRFKGGGFEHEYNLEARSLIMKASFSGLPSSYYKYSCTVVSKKNKP